jgi:hypothetical protein
MGWVFLKVLIVSIDALGIVEVKHLWEEQIWWFNLYDDTTDLYE